MRVLVTGAAGRLGSVVAKKLVEAGYQVRATDQRSHARVEVPVEIESLLLPEACYRLVQGCEAVVHLANHPSLGNGQTPQAVYNENCAMTGNVIQAALDFGVTQLVYASTIQVMSGKTYRSRWDGPETCRLTYLPIDGDSPILASNYYAASKVAGEELLRSCCRARQLNAAAIRFPALVSKADEARHQAWRARRGKRTSTADDEAWGAEDAFAFLYFEDAADLIVAMLRHGWQGYRCVLPADARNTAGVPAREAYERWLSHVPLRVPLDELTALADCRDLERDFGWVQPGKTAAATPATASA